jgi:hypothetical protein
MKGKAVFSGLLVLALAAGVFLAGCASPQGGGAGAGPGVSQSDLLQQAGFRVYTADTPQKGAYLSALPAKKVVSTQYQGQTHYLVCTTPGSQQCYVGDQTAYQRYQQLAAQAAVAQDQAKVSEQRFDPEGLVMWAESQGGGS